MAIISINQLAVFPMAIAATQVSTASFSGGITGMLHGLYDSMFFELCVLAVFLLGTILLRLDKVRKTVSVTPLDLAVKTIGVEHSAGNHDAVVKAFFQLAALNLSTALPCTTVRSVMHSLLETNPAQVSDLAAYLGAFANPLAEDKKKRSRSQEQQRTTILNILLKVALSRSAKNFQALFESLSALNASADDETFELRLAGHARAGDAAAVASVLADMRSTCGVVSPGAYTGIVGGLARSGDVVGALQYVDALIKDGAHLGTNAVTELFRNAGARVEDVLAQCAAQPQALPVSQEALAHALDFAAKAKSAELAAKCIEFSAAQEVGFNYWCYDSIVKTFAQAADLKAIEYFDELTKTGFTISEGSLVGMICACAESKFFRAAEHFVAYKRAESKMTCSSYSALMKVFAAAKMYEEACGVYDQVIEDGLEPDNMMTGCLVNFAARCGRNDIFAKLSASTSFEPVAQNFMSQIRACRASHDTSKAMKFLEEMRAQSLADPTAHNSVLDVCVTSGELDKASSLFSSMKENDMVDVISYNTMLKAYCQNSKVKQALALLDEMRAQGPKPNDCSFNCVLNAHVAQRDFSAAVDCVKKMQADGVQEDGYTVSTLAKALKMTQDRSFVRFVLDLFDSTQVDVLKDEVLLNVMLDAFVRMRDMRRLNTLIHKVREAKMSPTVSVLNTMLKALSSLKRVDDCLDLWSEMTTVRDMQPNTISIGCMVDALVSNGKFEEAAALVETWKGKVKPNCIIYSTLMKGFALARDAEGALKLLKQMEAENIAPTVVTVNTLIDACGRAGRMDQCVELLDSMKSMGLQPDRVTFSTIIKGYAIKGDFEKAVALMDVMPQNGLRPDIIVFNTVLDACVSNDSLALCDKLYLRMLKAGIKPTNFTATVMIKRFGREGKVDQAFEVVDDMPKAGGFTLNTQAMTCLISACCINRQAKRALDVFDRMKKTGPVPDSVTYEKLIGGMVRANNPDKACWLVEDAFGLHGALGHVGDSASTFPTGTVTPCGSVQRVSTLDARVLDRMVSDLHYRGLTESHAVPLLMKLRDSGVPVPQRLVAATLCSAATPGAPKGKGKGAAKGAPTVAPWSKAPWSKGKGK